MANAQDAIKIIKDLAKKEGVSVNKMLLSCGINTSLLTDMKRRGTIPSAETLAKIASYFGVSTDYLLGAETKKPLP